MFKGLGDLTSMIRQAQQMGGKLEEVSRRLKSKRATASAGAGMVEVEVNGLGEVLSVKIDPALTDREMLEDLLPAAVNLAVQKSKELHQQEMQAIAEDMNMPGLSEAMAKFTGDPES